MELTCLTSEIGKLCIAIALVLLQTRELLIVQSWQWQPACDCCEYYFRKILPVGKIPTTINSQQARSIASCIYLCSMLYIVTGKSIHN